MSCLAFKKGRPNVMGLTRSFAIIACTSQDFHIELTAVGASFAHSINISLLPFPPIADVPVCVL